MPRPRPPPQATGHRGRVDRDHSPHLQDTSTDSEERELIDGVLRRLDERERAIVVLHYYLGLPLTDVSAALGIPIGTVKSRLHRALGLMRVAIADDAPMSAVVGQEGRPA